MPTPDSRNPARVAGFDDATINRIARIVRWSAVPAVVVVLLLIFAVPRRPLPPPSPAQPEQAVVDRVGLGMAALHLRHPRALPVIAARVR